MSLNRVVHQVKLYIWSTRRPGRQGILSHGRNGHPCGYRENVETITNSRDDLSPDILYRLPPSELVSSIAPFKILSDKTSTSVAADNAIPITFNCPIFDSTCSIFHLYISAFPGQGDSPVPHGTTQTSLRQHR